METFIFLAIIGLLLYLPFRPTKVRRVITDQITWDLTDELHDIKCSIAEAKFMLESIESMRWNDRKEFEFSFINNVNLEGKTKKFQSNDDWSARQKTLERNQELCTHIHGASRGKIPSSNAPIVSASNENKCQGHCSS